MLLLLSFLSVLLLLLCVLLFVCLFVCLLVCFVLVFGFLLVSNFTQSGKLKSVKILQFGYFGVSINSDMDYGFFKVSM